MRIDRELYIARGGEGSRFASTFVEARVTLTVSFESPLSCHAKESRETWGVVATMEARAKIENNRKMDLKTIAMFGVLQRTSVSLDL